MKKIRVESKKYGILDILVDNDDYEKLQKNFNNLKWSITKNHNGLYAQKRVNKKNIYLHRYIMNNPNGIVDHKNLNTLDNRKSNLRITTNSNNLRNGNIRKNNKTGIKGVYYDKIRNKYIANIKVNYKTIFLGRFKTLEEAIKIRKQAELKYWEI